MDDKEKRFVDELLGASLRHYASAEPRPGLEGRVLAGVRSRQQAARRRATWAWAIGSAAGAAMVVFFVVHRPRHHTPAFSAAAKALVNVAAPTVAKIAPPARPTVPRRPQRSDARPKGDTRPQQFPTPRPLSEQEKLLLAYVRALRGSSVAPVPDANQDAEHDLEIPPLSITAIEIEPLASPGSEDER